MTSVPPKSARASKPETTTVRNWRAKPVLASDFTEAPPLREVYVGVLRQRKDTSVAIQSVSAILPGFAHLKRCSNGKLLLAPLYSDDESAQVKDHALSEDRLKDVLRKGGFDLSLLENHFQVTKVPAKAPRTKSQAGTASKAWPVNFHPDPTIECLMDGSIFNEDQLRTIEVITSLVIRAARLEAIGDERCTGAAAIVDPEDGRILTVAAARTDRHPMWHAAMLAVDLVARLHGGGAWQLDDGERNDRPTASTDITDEVERTPDAASADPERQYSEKRLKAIKRKYEEETPLCYPGSLSALSFPVIRAPLEGRRGRAKIENPGKEECGADGGGVKYGPYLCTGYWAFMLMEPCPLCAMALLHSRVARIFYGTANRHAGVLGTRAVLHTMPGLNHRYRVWSGILEEECGQTVEEINARGGARLRSTDTERVYAAEDDNAPSAR